MSLVFYVAHCPFDEKSQDILQVCIQSIEKHHPQSEIFVLYSESNLPCIVRNQSANVKVLPSPIQNSSVIGCFYHYLQSKEERKAIFIHDSMILLSNLDPSTQNNFGFLWYFDGDLYAGLESITCGDIKIKLSDAMNQYPNTYYTGCFGLCLYSNREKLEKLWGAIDFYFYVNHPRRAQALMDLERVLGFYASALGLGNGSICGTIFGTPNAFNRWYTNQTLEEIEKMGYTSPVVKAWMNRFLRDA